MSELKLGAKLLTVPPNSDEEMEEANPVEANDSDYDPNKETKKEASGHRPGVGAVKVRRRRQPLMEASMLTGSVQPSGRGGLPPHRPALVQSQCTFTTLVFVPTDPGGGRNPSS